MGSKRLQTINRNIRVTKMFKLSLLLLFVNFLALTYADDGYGKGGGGGSGSACIVKGSYCSCHYCRCEKGQINCGKGYGHGGGYGKKYCYGGMEGEYCHCDYCKCKNGFGFASKGGYGHKGYGGC